MKLVESDNRIFEIPPACRTRFRWRAERVARRRNADRFIESYTWKVIREDGLFVVVPFQNYLVPTLRAVR